ncbi:GGDEF domain-containing protein [Lutimaribacter sp. EGI FJ00015]|uniref:GGDEF domain-containing protein n=1 Tax=Lutimaribacter degradans TaxID=2945989 RepID=A0ACC5ZRJ0_9RHOB|nr:GGDEF domain-containing protein [Lutimaribacter sp. EGI FJ00013]MCM2560760.1 GGDEF domain-containing protein [Lutimaribacter sp. EGI FJ00013]MCO0612294.1 GGDEF domain-containing protein [Lutimaribacter sp. EGI FJ00015]MCO0634585.1 GGDEF domain-containing protein [Lutimaribacter sp. EGI FJ00014]
MRALDVIPVLDALCPMHMVLSGTGHVTHAGATLCKLRPMQDLQNARFLELFEVQRPRGLTTMEDLRRVAGTRMHLQFRDTPKTGFKGILVPWQDGAVVNLSFGISILDAVRDYALTNADFAATDMTVEMLYLVEAKSAAMEASRKLNQRLQAARVAAEEQAYTDTLTGLKNRRALDHVLNRLGESGAPFALMHLDLDFFKSVNDTLGHAAGDRVLQKVARYLVDETREQDTVARVGGDEFVIVLPGLTDPARIESIARRIIDRLEKPIPFQGKMCRISCSIGTTRSDLYRRPDMARMMGDADVALYVSKRQGRARHTIYEPSPADTPPDPRPALQAAQK